MCLFLFPLCMTFIKLSAVEFELPVFCVLLIYYMHAFGMFRIYSLYSTHSFCQALTQVLLSAAVCNTA